MGWLVPANFDWQHYHQLNPAEYDWPMVLGPPRECRDAVAQPHPMLSVGSCVADIPQSALAVVNVASECRCRADVGNRRYFHLPLADPFAQSSAGVFARAVRLAVALATHSRHAFVHCMSGMSRSVSVAATAAAMLRGEDVVDMLVEMSEQRPEVYPDEAYIILGQWLNGELPPVL